VLLQALRNAEVAAYSCKRTDEGRYASDTFIRTALLLIAVGIAACNPRVDAPPRGVYRAVLRLPGGGAPFDLEVAQEQQPYVLLSDQRR
jgi:hypothetical protein